MSEQYKLIKSIHYNDIQSKISNVLGVGSNDYGYGQTVLSSQISLGAKISSNQWSNLRTDILKAKIHQTGATETEVLTNPTVDTIITDADRQSYLDMATSCETNRYIIPPLNQATQDILVTGTNLTSWNSTLTHTVTITFTNAAEMRYFFNSGSCIDISASRTNGSTTAKNTSWTSLLSAVGTIRIGMYNSYQITGSTPVLTSVIGASELTTTDSLIFTKSPSEGLTSNSYNIRAKISTTSSTTIILTISFIDADGTGTSDINVDGTLVSLVKTYRASGNYVTVAGPSATGTFSGGEVVSVYAIGINSTNVNEGSSFDITISGQAVPPLETTYYLTTLTTTGTVDSTDFGTGDYFNSTPITVSLITSENLDKNFIYADTSIVRADLRSEGVEKFKLELRRGSSTGTLVATSPEITVNDTSITSESFSISADKSSVDEGGIVTFTISGNAVLSSNTTYYLTTSGTVISADFTNGYYNNNPIIVSLVTDTYGDKYFTKIITATLSLDQLSEGSENFKLQLRATSNGSAIAESDSITVNDTSITIPVVTVPTTTYVLDFTAFSISDGVANNGWYMEFWKDTAPTNKGRYPVSAGAKLYLNSSGGYSSTTGYGDISFYPKSGAHTLKFIFDNGTTVTKNVTVNYKDITITGENTGVVGTTQSVLVANGPINGTYYVTDQYNNTTATLTLDQYGSHTNTFIPTTPGEFIYTFHFSDSRTATKTITYSVTPYSHTWTNDDNWTVPEYVYAINVTVNGAGGGGGGNDNYTGLAGRGGNVVSGTGYPVNPGDIISIIIGAGGNHGVSDVRDTGSAPGGYSSLGSGGSSGNGGADNDSGSGGGGGGASGISVNGIVVIVAGGGGGGGGAGGNYSTPQYGGGYSGIGSTGGGGVRLLGGPKGKGDDGGGGGGGGGGYFDGTNVGGGQGGGVIRNGYLTNGTSGNGSDTYGAYGLNGLNLVPSNFSATTAGAGNGGDSLTTGGNGSVTISYP
jgi:hypothetical protein